MTRHATMLMTLAATVASIGCKHTPDAVPEPAATGAKPAAATPVNAPSPSAEAPARASASTPSPVATAAPAAAPERLYPIVEARYEPTFIPGAGRALLVGDDGAAIELRNGSLVQARGFADGLAPYTSNGSEKKGTLEGFGGRWPDRVYAIIGAYALRGTTDHQVHTWRGGSWQTGLSSGNADFARVTAVEPYGSGFAAAVIGMSGAYRLENDDGKPFAPRKGPKAGDDGTRLRLVTALDAPPGGGLVAIGNDGDHEAIEVFADDGSSKALVELPALDDVTIEAASLSEIYVAGVPSAPRAPKPAASASAAASAAAPATAPPRKPYFAVLSGSAWSPRPGPGDQPITSLSASPDGSLWATSGGGVWRMPRGGAWSRVALPEGAQASSVMAESASDVWALEREKGRLRVFGSKPARWPLVLAEPEGEAPKAVPATAACATPFVLMYAIKPETFGREYDFPLTRKALKGHTELAGIALVLTEHYQVGAFVPSIEVGEKLAGIIRDNVKGQKPQVVCMAPRVRVEIPVDLATGELAR